MFESRLRQAKESLISGFLRRVRANVQQNNDLDLSMRNQPITAEPMFKVIYVYVYNI